MIKRFGFCNLMVLLLLFSSLASANPGVIDRIETAEGAGESRATIHFSLPLRYISHLDNSRKDEIEIRVKPVVLPGSELDLFGGEQTLSYRESDEIPLDRVRFQGESTGTSRLVLSFSRSLDGYQIEQNDQFSITLRILSNRASKGGDDVADAISAPVPHTDSGSPESPAHELPGRYVINLLSQNEPLDVAAISRSPLFEGKHLYSVPAEVNGVVWQRLRVGFYRRADALAALEQLRGDYPGAWIDLASADERGARTTQAQPERVNTTEPGPAQTEEPAQAAEPASATDDRLGNMMNSARTAMTEGDYPRTIRMLTAILELEQNAYSREALELLGVARERNGQFAHANAEYNRYLEKYPEGEDADRVRQRLAGLITATQQPRERRRQGKRSRVREDQPWDVYGSLSQFYREDRIESDFVEGDDAINRRQIDSNLDLFGRKRTATSDIRLRFSGGHELDLLPDGPGNDESISYAYASYEGENNLSASVGRQRFRSSGILGRFDGAVAGYRFDDIAKVNLYAGIPVERSSDTFIRDDKHFIGLNAEFDRLLDEVDFTLFAIEQKNDGLVDRQAVGVEARYADESRSIFGLLDYDIHYSELNTFLLQTSWTLNEKIRLYANYDYRNSPFLTTGNALIGQSLTSLELLQETYFPDEIYDIAQDRTATSHVFSFGGTMSLSDDLQLSGDLTLSNISDTPASAGVDATEETGNELYYTLQVFKNNLLKEGDIGIFSLRYTDSMSADTVTLTANSRYPINSLWRVKPRLSASYREDKEDGDSRTSVGGLLQGEYRLRKDLVFELEAGMNWYSEESTDYREKYLDYFLGLGYRWTF